MRSAIFSIWLDIARSIDCSAGQTTLASLTPLKIFEKRHSLRAPIAPTLHPTFWGFNCEQVEMSILEGFMNYKLRIIIIELSGSENDHTRISPK